MNIARNEVNEFQYASASIVGKQTITVISSASPLRSYTFRITDIKMSAATAMNLKLLIGSAAAQQAIRLKCAANSHASYNFEIPYKLNVISSTTETRRFVASTDTTGGNLVITGYVEKQ